MDTTTPIKPNRIYPHADGTTEVLPPCAGSWIRAEDGGLIPGDEATAKAAGLRWSSTPEAVADAPTSVTPEN